MKRTVLAIAVFLFLALVFTSCKLQPSLPRMFKAASDTASVNSAASSQASVPDSMKYDMLLTNLTALQNEIYRSPASTDAVKLLTKSSYDSADGCFLVVGKGAANKSHPEQAWGQGRKMAASYDGKRWALYLKAWSEGSSIAFGKKISGEITYSRVLRERLEGDTLYQLIQVPFGSVIVK